MANSGKQHQWNRVSRHHTCAICQNPDWCMVSADGAVALCMRIQEGAFRRTNGGGYLHRLRDVKKAEKRYCRTYSVASSRTADLAGQLIQYAANLDYPRLERFSQAIGISVQSLLRLRIGLSHDRRAWTFPMVDGTDRVVGFRFRLPDGRKYSLKGGHEGLFVPNDLSRPRHLVICEGPTDTGALLDLGFQAIGRPSCQGGVQNVIDLIRRIQPAAITLIADNDLPGQRGADQLAADLRLLSRYVRVASPPESFKDIRAWKQAGAGYVDVMQRIDAVPYRLLSVRTLRQRKEACHG